MLLKKVLKRIAENRLKDSNVLLRNKRYNAAIYLAGYAIELMLKLKICHIFRFKHGFPENEIEFNTCKDAASFAFFSTAIAKLKQIKHHNLAELLRYSGKEITIFTKCSSEWAGILNWGPNHRYSSKIVRKATAAEFIRNCKIIIENL
ncbi:HEPN domain-containing protein [Chitinophaga niabensis]|uniref:HEPN domain-containing protein n=1 Tax=Chitinophaga niabensis TaxID=536979 RepID=A0A1N6E5Y2_9BACT|nr:HEPN domain-containing protein [Chitinophaga niabensis]SIN78465.1 HEPN domain-containing protein [Chitinophaga niabensis]